MSLSSPDQIRRDCSLWLPYAAILNFTLSNDNPIFTNAADPLGVIPVGWPYPTGGWNLGVINGSIKVKKGSDLQDLPPSGTNKVADERFFQSYKRVVEFDLLSSGRKIIVDIFDDPGPRTSNASSGGGETAASGYPLAIMLYDAFHPEMFLCYIHWDVTPLPADEELGGQTPSIIKAVFRCYAGKDPNDPACLRQPGTQVWRRLYIDISGNTINAEDPESVSSIDPNASNKAYPAINMVGGMIGI